jgi:tetratricopeptide (TPR) repeat protein
MNISFSAQVTRAANLARSDPCAAVLALANLHAIKPANPRLTSQLRKTVENHRDRLRLAAQTYAHQRNWAAVVDLTLPVLKNGRADSSLAHLAAQALTKSGRALQASTVLLPYVQSDNNDDALLVTYAMALRDAGLPEQAQPFLEQAATRGSQHASTGLGLVLAEQGQLAAASDTWRATVARWPDAADAWLHWAMMGDLSNDTSACADLDQISGRIAPPESRVCLDFARGNVCLKNDNPELGFHLLNRANSTHLKSIRFDPDRLPALETAIHTSCSKLPLPDPKPTKTVFITGVPRTGTSLIEFTLSADDRITLGGELPAFFQALRPHFGVRELADASVLDDIAVTYHDQTRHLRENNRILTDKMPLNFRWIGVILAAMPDARVIHVQRNPMATGLSLYRHHFLGSANAFSYEFDTIAQFIQFERTLTKFWQDRWGKDRLMVVDFDKFTADPANASAEISAFCGLPASDVLSDEEILRDPLDNTCDPPNRPHHRYVRTASAGQVRTEIGHDTNKDWQRWRDHLAPLETALSQTRFLEP